MDKEAAMDEKNELPFLPMGSLVKAKLEFKHIETGESIHTSPRPVVVLRDHGDGSVKIATLTSRIEKNHVAKLGYILEDSKNYGLDKKSAILCTRFNMGYLARENLSEPFGKVPLPELKKALEKAVMLNNKEHHLHMKLMSEYER